MAVFSSSGEIKAVVQKPKIPAMPMIARVSRMEYPSLRRDSIGGGLAGSGSMGDYREYNFHIQQNSHFSFNFMRFLALLRIDALEPRSAIRGLLGRVGSRGVSGRACSRRGSLLSFLGRVLLPTAFSMNPARPLFFLLMASARFSRRGLPSPMGILISEGAARERRTSDIAERWASR